MPTLRTVTLWERREGEALPGICHELTVATETDDAVEIVRVIRGQVAAELLDMRYPWLRYATVDVANDAELRVELP